MTTELRFPQFGQINRLAADLYNDEAPLHNRIVSFLHSLMGIVYFDRATILFFYMDEDGRYTKHSSISLNWEKEQDYVKRYNDYYCHVDDTLPIMDQPNPILFRASKFFNYEIRSETEYWKDYLVPNNCIYSIEGNLQLNSSHRLKGGIVFYRGKEKCDFTETDVAIISLLQPHLSNVLKHYGEPSDSSSVLFMLDNYNCVGVAILDDRYQIVRSNNTYRSLAANETFGKDIANKAINLCINLSRGNGKGNSISAEYKFDEAPVFMEVTKVPPGSVHACAQYCCLVYDLSHLMSQTLNQAKEKYVLTPREFEIVQAILKGKSNEEIAEDLFLSIPTVKKYLASLYSKMEIKNQKQLFEKLKLQ